MALKIWRKLVQYTVSTENRCTDYAVTVLMKLS